MAEQQITNNEKLSEILPMLREQYDFINSKSVKDYEDKLTKVTNKALASLEGIIDDGSLALDPEQLVAAVKVLTKSKADITESKRRLIETLLRGEVMIKALEPKKNDNGDKNDALLEYLHRQGIDEKTNSNSASIFQDINNLEK
ncbi:MAG: hypothetical protein IKS48_00455 [Eubacterium sp.]|nr:hypothetical protein [Eubacterium sp.]